LIPGHRQLWACCHISCCARARPFVNNHLATGCDRAPREIRAVIKRSLLVAAAWSRGAQAWGGEWQADAARLAPSAVRGRALKKRLGRMVLVWGRVKIKRISRGPRVA
jgi:hypothetical protein